MVTQFSIGGFRNKSERGFKMKKIFDLPMPLFVILVVLLLVATAVVSMAIGAVSSASDDYNAVWLEQAPVAYPASFTICDLSTGQTSEITAYSPDEWKIQVDRVEADPLLEFNTCH